MTERLTGRRAPRALAPRTLVAAAAATVAALPLGAQPVRPVLAFPEPGLDDSAAYAGYQTRLVRDAAGNTVQVYLDERQARVVHVLADAENESVGLTARGADGRPVALRWNASGSVATRRGRTRTLTTALAAGVPEVRLSQFLLGSMRVERDFQYFQGQRRPFASEPVQEVDSLVAALERLEPAERARHLALLHAPSVAALRVRLRPTIAITGGPRRVSGVTARIVQPTLDGRDTLALEVAVGPRRGTLRRVGDTLVVRSDGAGDGAQFTVRVSTTARALTPLTRRELFTPAFLDFASAEARRAPGSVRARLLERQIRSVELLASREKLMAGLPTYATYFGRDMMVSALMMRPVWRPEVSGFVVASVLRNLAPDGQVSHEEALGGQAVRESAAEYAGLLAARTRAAAAGDQARADRLRDSARTVLRDLRVTRQNYHMVDDELQLVVLAGRYLRDPAVSAAAKRAFLRDARDGSGRAAGEPRVARLVRELAYVARMTAPYGRTRAVADLVSFPVRDTVDGRVRYFAASWRDSGVGYGGGRYGWDVNAIWAPHALEAMGHILATLRELGYGPDALARLVPGAAAGTPLGTYARDPEALARAVAAWREAGRHFVVRLGPDEVRARVAARVAAFPEAERAYWTARVAESRADRDSLVFDAVALDAAGQPIGVANTDGATRLFLGDTEGLVPSATPPADAAAHVRRDVALFARAYPAGLLVDHVGPVVSNDAYATPDVWRAFAEDLYHSPRVVWGREVNLFLLGVADRLPAAGADATEMRSAMDRVRVATDAAGFRSELWSYEFRDGRPAAVRYGSGNDLQLWTTTDLAVQYVLSRLGGR